MSKVIRLSPDVANIAGEIARQRGLGSPKVAIEAIVRTCWEHYLAGNCVPSTATTAPPLAAPGLEESIDAIAALNDVM